MNNLTSILTHFKSKKVVIGLSMVVVTTILIIVGLFIYSKKIKKEPQSIKSEVDILIEEVRALIDVPISETPTVATVTDSEKLKSSAEQNVLFQKAENGDIVLVFSGAKKAVLYRPSIKKVIDIVPVITEEEASKSAQAAVLETPFTYAIYNGTSVTGLAKKIEDLLVAKLPSSRVNQKSNAAQSTYKESFIVALTDSAKKSSDKIASQLGFKSSELPKEEKLPQGVDFLIIAGEDQSN